MKIDDNYFKPALSMDVKRIQRKRTKGWKMPENTVYVGRPTLWGNPFGYEWSRLNGGWLLNLLDVTAFTRSIWAPHAATLYKTKQEAQAAAVDCYKQYIAGDRGVSHSYYALIWMQNIEHELRGKNLACWCADGEPCHADVLLEIANK